MTLSDLAPGPMKLLRVCWGWRDRRGGAEPVGEYGRRAGVISQAVACPSA
jgi:hypothetical protein